MKNTVTYCFVFPPFLFFLLLVLSLFTVSTTWGQYRIPCVTLPPTELTLDKKRCLAVTGRMFPGWGRIQKSHFVFCKQNLWVINGVICTKCDVRPQLFTCQISTILETFYLDIVKCNLYTGVTLLLFFSYLLGAFICLITLLLQAHIQQSLNSSTDCL